MILSRYSLPLWRCFMAALAVVVFTAAGFAQSGSGPPPDLRHQLDGIQPSTLVEVIMRDGSVQRGRLLAAGYQGITILPENASRRVTIPYSDIQSLKPTTPEEPPASPSQPSPTRRPKAASSRRAPEMPVWLVVVIAGGSLSIIMLVIWLVLRQARQRRQALKVFALQSGFAFDPYPSWVSPVSNPADYDPEDVAPEEEEGLFTKEEYDQLSHLHSGGKENGLRGQTAAGEVVIYDGLFGSGKYRYYETIAAFRREGRNLPHFDLRPRGWFDKLGDALGRRHITFDSSPQFSQLWELRGRDEGGIFAIFSPETLVAFEALDAHQHWCVQAAGSWVVLWRDHKRIEAADLRSFLDQATAIAARF